MNREDYSAEEIAAWSGRATARRVRNSHKLAIRLVAIEKGRIVGFVDISRAHPEKLWGLYVHRDFIGKGVGSRLLKKIEEVAKRKGVKKFVTSSTVTAKPFYKSKGFKVLKAARHPIGHRKLRVFIMEKVL